MLSNCPVNIVVFSRKCYCPFIFHINRIVQGWASHKSFRPVDPVAKDKNDQEPKPPAAPWDENNPTINYRGEKRSNHTHCSTTDPEAMLARKGRGKEAKLSYHGHPGELAEILSRLI